MLQEVVHMLFKKCYQKQNYPSQIHLFICNQQLFFTFDTHVSPYINNDDNNNTKAPTLKRIFKLSNGIHIKKYKI
jgi:hypothetical protein